MPIAAQAIFAFLLILPALGSAQSTAPLNDTGQNQCLNASNQLATCNSASVGDSATYPGQDARYGRDVAAMTKIGDGAAGFDFTAINSIGDPTVPGNHACVKDNVTGLLWSAQTLGSMSWTAAMVAYPNAGTGAYSRCGRASGWRLPTRREFLSIVHYGATSGFFIDSTYFPGSAYAYWTSESFARYEQVAAWYVWISYGDIVTASKTDAYWVRLVRSE